MSSDIPSGSLAHGEIFITLFWDEQPLHSDSTLILELPLTDGIIAILVLERRLLVEIGRIETGSMTLADQWITPEFAKFPEQIVLLTLQWENGRISTFRLNGRDVPRSSEVEEVFDLKQDFKRAEERKIGSQQVVAIDLKNFAAPMSLAFRQLLQTAKRLEASLDSLRSDTPESILDVAGYLRTLLCGTAGNGGKLIFQCAAELGIEPVCYRFPVSDTTKGDFPLLDTTTLILHEVPSAFPDAKQSEEIKLADWLLLPALTTSSPHMPHWQLIRDVAVKFGVHAELKESNSLLSLMDTHSAGVNLGVLVPRFRAYGFLALLISKALIQAMMDRSK